MILGQGKVREKGRRAKKMFQMRVKGHRLDMPQDRPNRSPITDIHIQTAILLALLLCGCTTTKQNGLYINHRLVKESASIEDFCLAQGRAGLFHNGKEILSK